LQNTNDYLVIELTECLTSMTYLQSCLRANLLASNKVILPVDPIEEILILKAKPVHL